ncbi:hypothetical protein SEA_WENTWORTH_82 [Streptomyces phage Wentworth]|nr:hypothetical protein SEA_WENTWORTH_82 [Streptomyces phage Wentworth]
MAQSTRPRMSVEPKVVEHLLASRGRIVTLAELVKALPRGAQEASVRSVMRRLADRMDITVISKGNSWRLENESNPDTSDKANPDAGKSLGLFELVGRKEDDTMVVRDEDGRLYDLTPQ